MARTPPPTIDPGPAQPTRGDKTTFSIRIDAFVTWVIAAVAQFAALGVNVYNNAVDAYNNAGAAATSATNASTSEGNAAASVTAATVAANATLWVSGATVAQDASKISPADRKTYRKKTASSSTTTDPSLDPTNYVLISNQTYALTLLATITPTASANLDFLTTFSSTYDHYLILIDGVNSSANDQLVMRLAVAGAVDTGTNYGAGSSAVNYMSLSGSSLAAGAGVTKIVHVLNVNSTSIKSVNATGSSNGTAGQTWDSGVYSAAYFAASIVTGFRLYWGSGASFTAVGKIRVYGYQN